MRKRDFEAIAGAVKRARDSLASSLSPVEASAASAKLDSLAFALADVCQRQSARFQRMRFLNDCGVSAENIKKDLTRLGVVLIS
jgi:hypothetical protein